MTKYLFCYVRAYKSEYVTEFLFPFYLFNLAVSIIKVWLSSAVDIESVITMEIVKREYTEPCTPTILEEIAADKAGEFGSIQQGLFNEVYPNVLIGGE